MWESWVGECESAGSLLEVVFVVRFRPFDRQRVFFIEPLTEVDELTAQTAKRHHRRILRVEFARAGRTTDDGHGAVTARRFGAAPCEALLRFLSARFAAVG